MGGKGCTISREPNHYGGSEPTQGAPKGSSNVTSDFSIQYICFRKTSVSNMGEPTCLLTRGPSNVVTPLVRAPSVRHSNF